MPSVLPEKAEQVLTLFGYRVTRASSAEDAIELLDTGDVHFDIVLSDVVMPGGMSGIANDPSSRVTAKYGWSNTAMKARGQEHFKRKKL